MTTQAHRRPRQTESHLDRPDDAAARLLLTVEQAAGRLNVGRSTAYGLVQSGQLESVTVGRLRRIPADAIAAFVDSLRRARA
jgi:excisionase family DNA binding protein